MKVFFFLLCLLLGCILGSCAYGPDTSADVQTAAMSFIPGAQPTMMADGRMGMVNYGGGGGSPQKRSTMLNP